MRNAYKGGKVPPKKPNIGNNLQTGQILKTSTTTVLITTQN